MYSATVVTPPTHQCRCKYTKKPHIIINPISKFKIAICDIHFMVHNNGKGFLVEKIKNPNAMQMAYMYE